MVLKMIKKYFLNPIFIIMCVLVVISMFQGVQNFIHSFFILYFKEEWYTSLSILFSKYRIVILILCDLYILFAIYKWSLKERITAFIERRNWRENIRHSKAGDLAHELYNFIISNDKTCFLLDGSWGVGKTFKVNEFAEQVKKTRFRNIYRISCFGLADRKSITDELFKECESSDTTFRKKYVDLVKHIPVVGNLLHSDLAPRNRASYNVRRKRKRLTKELKEDAKKKLHYRTDHRQATGGRTALQPGENDR